MAAAVAAAVAATAAAAAAAAAATYHCHHAQHHSSYHLGRLAFAAGPQQQHGQARCCVSSTAQGGARGREEDENGCREDQDLSGVGGRGRERYRSLMFSRNASAQLEVGPRRLFQIVVVLFDPRMGVGSVKLQPGTRYQSILQPLKPFVAQILVKPVA